jgi:hypothetical protein
MKYLVLIILIFSLPAQAQMMSSDSGIREPQSMRVSSNNMPEPEDPDFDSEPMNDPVTNTADIPVMPTEPIDPFTPAPEPVVRQQTSKQVLKKIPSVKVQRSIADDRIDDSYVQEMIKNNFNFTNTIE